MMGGEAGITAGVEAGVMMGGEAGVMMGGEAGITAGGEAGVMMGGEAGAEPPITPYGMPHFEGSTLAEVAGETRLAWVTDEGVWMMGVGAEGEQLWARLTPFSELEGGEELALLPSQTLSLKSAVSEGRAWVMMSAPSAPSAPGLLFELNDHPPAPLSLPLSARLEVLPFERGLLISGLSLEGQGAGWLWLDPNAPAALNSALSPITGPDPWPAPSSLGLVSGRPWLRFDEAGQCVGLNAELQPVVNNPCLRGEGALLTDGVSSYLTFTRPGEDGVIVSLAHQPDLAASYEVASLRAGESGLTGHSFARQPHRRAVLGVRLVEEEDAQLRDRLMIIEPSGLWVSEEGWARWPYEGARLITRAGQEAWVFEFSPSEPPIRHVVPLQANTFRERTPFGLSVDDRCRPSAEICDELDNNCDGIVDNGVCCAPFRAPLEALFTPLDEPTDFFVADVEDKLATRIVVRTAEARWEAWNLYYPTGSLGTRLYYQGLITGAHEGFGFNAAGGYSALLARDDEDAWSIFWHYSNPSTPVKAPEPLGCERVLDFGVMGFLPASTSPFVICDDRIIHVRSDRDPETDALLPNVSHEAPLAAFPSLEWATITRHFNRGTSSVLFAFESLSGSWEVNKLSLNLAANQLNVQVSTSVTARLGLNPNERPSPMYLHSDEAPGVPGDFPVLRLTPTSQSEGNTEGNAKSISASVHLPSAGQSGQAAWRDVQMGGALEEVQYAELQGKVMGARRTAPDEVSFWVVDLQSDEELNLWSSAPAIVWRSPTGPEGVNKMRWRLIRGDYRNYLALLSPRDNGAWAVTLYSVMSCLR
jgi:hypothetical protein